MSMFGTSRQSINSAAFNRKWPQGPEIPLNPLPDITNKGVMDNTKTIGLSFKLRILYVQHTHMHTNLLATVTKHSYSLNLEKVKTLSLY